MSLPIDWDNYDPCKKRTFYQSQINLLKEERNEYEPTSENWKRAEKTRIETICKLAEIIDEADEYEQNQRT